MNHTVTYLIFCQGAFGTFVGLVATMKRIRDPFSVDFLVVRSLDFPLCLISEKYTIY